MPIDKKDYAKTMVFLHPPTVSDWGSKGSQFLGVEKLPFAKTVYILTQAADPDVRDHQKGQVTSKSQVQDSQD